MNPVSTTYNLDNKKLFGFFSLASSLISLIAFITTLQQKPPVPNQILSYFEAHKGNYILFAALSLTWSIVSVPVIVSIGLLTTKIGQKNMTLTSIILTSAGVLLSGTVSFLYVGACLAVEGAKSVQGANIDYQISFWTNLFYFMTDPALMIWGFGQLLLGILVMRTKDFPKWLSIIVIVGGIAGLLTLIVFQTPILALLQQLTFLILTVYMTFYFFRKNVA